jgi:hypothetical protein
MVWITPKLDQMVRFPGKIIDIRKRDMLPSPAAGNKKSPVSRGSFKTSRAARQTKGIK